LRGREGEKGRWGEKAMDKGRKGEEEKGKRGEGEKLLPLKRLQTLQVALRERAKRRTGERLSCPEIG